MDIDFARPYFGDEERNAVARVMAGYWLANGKENEAFEDEFAKAHGGKYAICVNSGSSANLIALAALKLKPGSRVLTSGCGFPATLSPILHLGLTPVLVDYDLMTCNANIAQVLKEIPYVDAVILAHTMGNPVDMRMIVCEAKKHSVYVIEDCCEAIGAELDKKRVGTFGDIGTYSFYPSHQITALGGGGMILFKSHDYYLTAKSMRDWGKSAMWDGYGRTNTTYSSMVDGIQYFPHYVYENVGWNMRLPEANAAFGREQLKKLDWIVAQRENNRSCIMSMIGEKYRDFLLDVDVPRGAKPSWFGVLLVLNGIDRIKFADKLESLGVRHRPFFAGNITRHPPFRNHRKHLPIADELMKSAIFVGCYAGMTHKECEHIADSIEQAFDFCQIH